MKPNDYDYPRIIKEAAYGRVYEVEPGVYFPSVTTVLKYGLPTPEFLMKWMITQSGGDYDKHLHANNEASEIGTCVHNLIERLVLGEEITISDDPLEYVSGKNYYPTFTTTLAIRKGLQSFMAFWEAQSPKVESLEQLLYCTDMHDDEYLYPFCGRTDMIAHINGEKWLLDVKTSKVASKVLNYGIQLTMYKMLYDATHDEPIDRIGVIWAKKDFVAATPPRSVLAPIEYEFQPEMVHHAHAIFSRCYDGFQLGKPRIKDKAPRVFSLDMEDA
jgi:hypothetical protein